MHRRTVTLEKNYLFPTMFSTQADNCIIFFFYIFDITSLFEFEDPKIGISDKGLNTENAPKNHNS